MFGSMKRILARGIVNASECLGVCRFVAAPGSMVGADYFSHEVRRTSVWSCKAGTALLPQHVLDLAALFLNPSARILGFSPGFQVGIPDGFSDKLLDLAFRFVHLAFNLVPCA